VIKVKYNNWSKAKIAEGKKRATSRKEKKLRTSEQFSIVSGESGDASRFQVIDVIQLPLKVVANEFYQIEGAESTEDFIERWKDIYGGEFNPGERVFLHIFRRIEGQETTLSDF